MPSMQTTSLVWARRVIRGLIVLNRIAGCLIVVLFVASLAAEATVMNALTQGNASARLTFGMRAIMVLGVVSVVVVNVVLTRLASIVDTVGEGDPFSRINAVRLRTIAWSLAALETLNVVIGLLAAGASTEAVPLRIEWGVSVTRWLAVLLLFVLAQVFEHGAAMRDDLDGTV